MDCADRLIGLARQERHKRPSLARSPQPGEGKQWLVILMHPEPDLALALRLLTGPLAAPETMGSLGTIGRAASDNLHR